MAAVEAEEYATIYRLEQRHWWYVGMRDISLALLAPLLRRGETLRVLDAGCGTGGMLLTFDQMGAAAGIDYSPLALGFCRARGLRRTARASVTHLPFRTATFDLVTSFDVLYHLDVSDDGQALQEFARVLKPGGLLLLRLPAFEWLRSSHDAMVHTRHRYTAGEVRARVRKTGLDIVRLTYANTALLPVAAASRFAQRMRGQGEHPESDVQETTGVVNTVLRGVLAFEAALLRYFDFPAGVSVFCLARKPEPSVATPNL